MEQRVARGKAAREQTPRASHAALDLAPDRDPVALLDAQAPTRLPELLPIRYGRMLVSPFTFYRGAAAIMAHDLGPTPRAGLQTQLCGDAHLSNFGGFASPERQLVFDLNDFDETLPGPFEWDVKRLGTSFEIATRNRDFPRRQRRAAVLASVRAYREAMREFAAMGNLEVWYSRRTMHEIHAAVAAADSKMAKRVGGSIEAALTKDSMRAFSKLTHVVDGEPRIESDPPLVVALRDLAAGAREAARLSEELHAVFRQYRGTLQRDRNILLEGFRLVDLARKVVGVGSVGSRCWILLLVGRDHDDPLFLQAKEAQASVLEPYLGKSSAANHGQRIVEGQRLMQATSDIFLGWLRVGHGIDGGQRDFYVRQLWDWKTSADPELAPPALFPHYARLCGWTLARAHARSGDRVAIASYLGKSDAFDQAVADFATAYADTNERDHAALLEAEKRGRIKVQRGF